MTKVKVTGGTSAIVSGVRVSSRLKVEVPQGMSGRQLARWKARNEKALLAMVDSGSFGSLPSGEDTDTDEGDTLARQRVPRIFLLFYFFAYLFYIRYKTIQPSPEHG
jgi:hypothetical protein